MARPARFTRSRRHAVAAAGVVALAAAPLLAVADPVGAAPVSQTFSSPGAAAYTVPTGVCYVTVSATGGGGGTGRSGGAGGVGATVSGRVLVPPGAVLSIVVAGRGVDATNDQSGAGGIGGGGGGGAQQQQPLGGGGGGGGASAVSTGATALVVA